MLSVGSVSINCECKSCGHEAMAWRPSDNSYQTTECPKCGNRTFSKKMASLSRNHKIVYTNKRKKSL
jgi:DNA-directed RNA polymerase subunit RPC12/RpoP